MRLYCEDTMDPNKISWGQIARVAEHMEMGKAPCFLDSSKMQSYLSSHVSAACWVVRNWFLNRCYLHIWGVISSIVKGEIHLHSLLVFSTKYCCYFYWHVKVVAFEQEKKNIQSWIWVCPLLAIWNYTVKYSHLKCGILFMLGCCVAHVWWYTWYPICIQSSDINTVKQSNMGRIRV